MKDNCPMCNGKGLVFLAGRGVFPCNRCNATGMVSLSTGGLAACAEEFLAGRYDQAFQSALDLVMKDLSHEAVQILLTSLERKAADVEQDGNVRTFGAKWLKFFAKQPWEASLLELTLGKRSPTEVLKTAYNEMQRCQALYYAGARCLTRGALADARANFESCVNTRQRCFEFELAQGELKTLRASTTAAVSDRMDQERRADQAHKQGRFIEAQELAENALRLGRDEFDEKDPRLIPSINLLGAVCRRLGSYAAAEALLLEALETSRYCGLDAGPEHCAIVSNLAGLYEELGDYSKAQPLYEHVLELIQRSDIKQDRFKDKLLSTVLNNLAGLQTSLHGFADAEKLYEQALEIERQMVGENHPSYALVLHNIAELYRFTAKYSQAEALYHQALAINRAANGDFHLGVSSALNGLGLVSFATGDLARSEDLLRKALTITETALGLEHRQTSVAVANLAVCLAVRGKLSEARPLLNRKLMMDDQLLAEVFCMSSERQRAAFRELQRIDFDIFISFLCKYDHDADAGLSLMLRRRALEAEVLLVQRALVLRGRYPQLKVQLEQIDSLRQEIAKSTLAGPGPEGPAHHEAQLTEWRADRERMERNLAREIPEMNLSQRLRAADSGTVAAGLQEDAALIEFVRFNPFAFDTSASPSEKQWAPARYVAFVLIGGCGRRAEMLELGESAEIDAMVAGYRNTVSSDRVGASQHGMQHRTEPYVPPEIRLGEQLRKCVLDPVLDILEGRTRLFIVPDGDLSRLPFDVLPAGRNGGRLIDHYRISYLSSAREVLRFGSDGGLPGEAIVVADPDFDLARSTRWLAVRANGASRLIQRDYKEMHFGRLPGTKLEGERVAKMLGVRAWLEDRALESRIKGCHSPRVLHLATHGFFFEDSFRDPNTQNGTFGSLGLVGSPTGTSTANGGQQFGASVEDPLLRSGLALAGANVWLKGGELPPEAEDGLLTAEDVTGLDLQDTELVVLSACDTGLGDVQLGEGVLGLRRSFASAGAKTVVMSLWKVPDLQTSELMGCFYEHLLDGDGRADALRRAQLTIKAKYPDPVNWGAFICQGDPTSMSIPFTNRSSRIHRVI